MDLATGKVDTVERVRRFSVPEESVKYVAYLMEASRRPTTAPSGGETPTTPPATNPPANPEADPEVILGEDDFTLAPQGRGGRQGGRPGQGPGGPTGATGRSSGDLVIRDLTTGMNETIAEVSDFAWNQEGTRLVYVIAGREKTKDGVYVREMGAGGKTVTLRAGEGAVRSLTFDEKGKQVAFLCQEVVKDKPAAAPPTPYTLYHWEGGKDAATETVTAKTPGVSDGFIVSENASLRFSKDGERLYLATAPAPKPAQKDAPTPIAVDVWSTTDAEIQPMQKVRAEQERRRNYSAVYHIGAKRFVQLASPDLPVVSTIADENERYALGSSDRPYRQLISWDQEYRDYFLVDLKDGSKKPLLTKHGAAAILSPGAKYLLYWNEDEGAWYCLPTDGKKPAVNLTSKLGVSFADETHDTPNAASPYGTAGWTEGDKTVLLYDRYDIWEIKSDGTGARNVTRIGRNNKTVLRPIRLDTERRTIPTNEPLLLSATDDATKATGVWKLPAIEKDTPPTKLLMVDKAMGPITKAKNADTVLFTLSRFEEFPNLWTAPLDNLSAMKRISDANPQQANYVWGKAELIEYKSADGKPLRGILIKPENFDPAKKYPLMVYIYETMTDGLHRYYSPSPGTSINITRYVSNGYCVLLPDIFYTTGYPGESSLKCVVPGVQVVLDKGFVDPARVGIQGHSWGGYEITYLVTRTNIFRAVEAGAAVSNMVSAYGGIRWGTGMSRAFQYEKTQSRIGAPPWVKPLQYIENSPIFWVDKVQTPYLTLHNDADGAVPWYQGIEFVTALRRLGKEAYLFNYNGEDHGLLNRENQKHWTVHMAEYFDHYLLGAPRPEWMVKGVPFLERGTRDLSAFYGKKSEPATAAEATGESAGAGNDSQP
jgi:dipeptidyl aminopeptidase/acylaminoacyl peptidase